MKVAVVVGNPRPKSRTLSAACTLAALMGEKPADLVVDLATLGVQVLGGENRTNELERLIAEVQDTPVVIVASPTYKATYTGLLKLFLDQFPGGGLSGVVAIPLMMGGAPQHYLAPEVFLKPVLVELGATCPTKSIYLLEDVYDKRGVFDGWLESERQKVEALTSP